jgi:hypothetical protein
LHAIAIGVLLVRALSYEMVCWTYAIIGTVLGFALGLVLWVKLRERGGYR